MDHASRHRGRLARVAAGAVAAVLAAGIVLVPAGGTAAQVAVPSKPAIVNGAVWYLRNSMTTGSANSTFTYGTGGIPVMGDWDGDGHDTVGEVRPTPGAEGVVRYVWYLRNSNSAGPAQVMPFTYGRQIFVTGDLLGAIPVVGDWDGNGTDTPGIVYLPSDPTTDRMHWHLRNSNSAGPANTFLTYGVSDTPIAGDWDGDGDDTIGVVRGNQWLLKNGLGGGAADVSFAYGSTSIAELPVPGDWDGNGTYTPAVLRNVPTSDAEGGFETWLFRNSNSGGGANGQITFGSDSQPVFQPVETIPRLSWK
jgi:hypothetical protein